MSQTRTVARSFIEIRSIPLNTWKIIEQRQIFDVSSICFVFDWTFHESNTFAWLFHRCCCTCIDRNSVEFDRRFMFVSHRIQCTDFICVATDVLIRSCSTNVWCDDTRLTMLYNTDIALGQPMPMNVHSSHVFIDLTTSRRMSGFLPSKYLDSSFRASNKRWMIAISCTMWQLKHVRYNQLEKVMTSHTRMLNHDMIDPLIVFRVI
jgi:hypothetical protein